MAALLNELNSLAAELRSEKPTTRNKAVERMDSILTNSKSELIVLFRERKSGDLSWGDLFTSAIEGTLKHAAKVQESQDSKSIQTMMNKNHIFRAVVTKLIEYNLEDDNNFLSKSVIFNAITDGLSTRSAIKNFSSLFLHLLDRGIYKSPANVRDFKVNEYSRILSYLFEINVDNDEILRFELLRSITKTLELACKHVQIGPDMIAYLPEVSVYVSKAKDERRQAEVIKLFHLFVSELSLDYHHTVCIELQELLPVISAFYSSHMKAETKQIFFESIYISLHAIYPFIDKGDINTLNITLDENWSKTLRKLKSIVDLELKELKLRYIRTVAATSDKSHESFCKMAAVITYLMQWHVETNSSSEEEPTGSRAKILRTSDKLDLILSLVQPEQNAVNDIWLSICTELICNHEGVLNITNLKQTLETTLHILKLSMHVTQLRCVRLCLSAILSQEHTLKQQKSIPDDYCQALWTKIVAFLLADTASSHEMIYEKHSLFQTLIAHGKFTLDNCQNLLQTIMSSTTLKRTECIATVRLMLIHADLCGLVKTSELVCRFIEWTYETVDKIDAKSVLLNIAPLDANIVADTCAIAVINILNDKQFLKHHSSKEEAQPPFIANKAQLLLYKYNRKFICLEEHAKQLQQIKPMKNGFDLSKNCLFQSSYELLMRTLNFETSKETTCSDILIDLTSLHKLVCLMDAFMEYSIFGGENFLQCPLIKRIGFFLSHLEFQLKNNTPRNIERSDLYEIIQRLEVIFNILTSNTILLFDYLNKQPLEELIGFLGAALKYSATQQLRCEFDDWSGVSSVSLRVLARLCDSSTQRKDAFAHISRYQFNIRTDLKLILELIKIFCKHTTKNPENDHADKEIAEWFVDKLKLIFKLYYTNIEIVEEIITLLPEIFGYIKNLDDPLQNMFIALISLLKVAYRKSYSTTLTAKLIESIRHISWQCHQLHEQESFTNICLSVVKFLSFPTLDIQFATINAITALMDVNWLRGAVIATDAHFDFCQQLFALIDWKNLPITTVDLKQNSNAVTIQMLASLFAFSSYYQEVALQDLAYFCALRKLTEADLHAFQQIAAHFECSLSVLTKPYVTDLIHTWNAKKYPILKFPYYVCCKSRNEFVLQNLATISACLILYSNTDELKKLEKYGSEAKLIELALPILHAIAMADNAACPEAQGADYKNRMQTLRANLSLTSKPANESEKYYYCIQLLRDDSNFKRFFDSSVFYQPAKWQHLSYKSLMRALAHDITTGSNVEEENKIFCKHIKHSPLTLINLLAKLKEDCYNHHFYIDSVISFYKYCVTAKTIIISMPKKSAERITPTEQTYSQYLVRDTIFFVLHYVQTQTNAELQQLALKFLKELVLLLVQAEDHCSAVIKLYLNDIAKALVTLAENSPKSDIENLAVKIMRSIIIDSKMELSGALALLDEFPGTECFSELQEAQRAQQAVSGEHDLVSVIKTFLHTKNRGIEGFKATRQHISKNKSQLQQEHQLLYEFIKRLIDIVRNSTNADFSMEALKCLGEIGSLNIEGISYYFETEISFYEDVHSTTLEPMPNFVERVFVALEKLLLSFNVDTYQAVQEVALQIVRSRDGQKLLVSYPYFNVFHGSDKSKTFLETSTSINWLAALRATENLHYDKWVCSFVSKIFENCKWQAFQQLAEKDASFAESTLQPFVKVLMEDQKRHLNNLIEMLDYFFAEFVKRIGNGTTDDKAIYKDKRVIGKFLNICECIRIHNQWKVPVNLLDVVKACNYCQAYFMSIMYLELWAMSEQQTAATDKRNTEIMSNEDFQETASKAYQSIDCSDAIGGFLNPLESRLDFLHLNNDWTDILLEANSKDMASNELFAGILKRNGMLALAGLNQTDTAFDYEVCWRLCQWETPVAGHSKVNTLNDMEHEFEKHHFNALKCIFNREEQNSLVAIANARECVLSILREISVECLQSVYKYLTWLQLLQQAEDFCQVQFPANTPVASVFDKWQTEVDLEYGSFLCKEQIISHQIALFNTAGIRAKRKISEFYKDDPIEICLLKCIKDCKNAGEINLAKRNIAVLKNMQISNEQIKASMLLEDADICFRTGKPQVTRAILQHVLTLKSYSYCPQRVRACRMQGECLMESNTNTFQTVYNKYFTGSLELLNTFCKSKDKILQLHPHAFDLETFDEFETNNKKSIYETIAKYADREYTQLNTYVNSVEFEMKCNIIKQNREAAESVPKNEERDKRSGAVYLRNFANLEEREVKAVEQQLSEYLCIAVEHYIKYCEIDDSMSSAAIYRIIALWFANKQNEELQSKLKELINLVPSYKFICALNQMTARLTSENQAFVALLKDILIRCVKDHPHHTLYQLYALVYAFNDGTSNTSHDRVTISKEIIAKGKNKSNANIIKQLESTLPPLIEFANQVVSAQRITSIPLSDKLKRLRNLDAIQCPTIDLPVSVNKQYNVTSIVRWEEKVGLVGGINAPKKLTCLCSDGKTRPQLLKGKDDLRQDAVMQQVFAMINDLLKIDREATERKLMLRTYKVVPLSMRSGILEWCEDTLPIGMYLAGDTGAHKRYRPEDWSVNKCRQATSTHLQSDADKRYQVFTQICENIKPVFQYFWLEKFLVPGVWFERRLAYTNSVATTSIVGFIVGLGDRHTQNILIDNKTAEVIHIDFGIAFDQGKIMPTPETVPFRLTRDMVAPMGVCETNGIFKKSCEATMRILRQHQAVITTILEVLLYDPLYIWKVVLQSESPTNSSTNEEQNNLAKRALLSVQLKLEGKQTGIFGTSSVDVQVQRLINEAVSGRNLCMCYTGWDAYL